MKYTCLVQIKDKKCCRFPAMEGKQHCMFHYDINAICDELPQLSELLFEKLKNGLKLGVIHIKKGEFDWRPDQLQASKSYIHYWGYIMTETRTNVQIHKPRFYTKEEHKAYRDSVYKKWRKMKEDEFDDDSVEMEGDDLYPLIFGTLCLCITLAVLLWLYLYSETGQTIQKLLSDDKNRFEL